MKPTNSGEASFEEVYRTYYKGCLNFIAGSYPTLRDEEVEDICSETMMKAFRSFESFDVSKGNITTWLFKIAINTAKDHFLDQKKLPSSTMTMNSVSDEEKEAGYEPDIADPDTKSPIDMILEEEREEKKNENIEKLEGLEKEILLMRDRGDRYKDIAERLGIPETTCRTKFRRATQKLRRLMEVSDDLID